MLLFIKNLLFTVLVPGTVAFYVPIRLANGRHALRSGGLGRNGWMALVPLVVGSCIVLRCVWDFATAGRGTPAPIDAPKHLVVRGLYLYVRNPMYVGVLLVVMGWAVFFWSQRIFLYGCAVAAAFHIFVVFFEEPQLMRRFGASYEAYRQAVRRWIPGKRYEGAA